jgi:hypothetical protein
MPHITKTPLPACIDLQAIPIINQSTTGEIIMTNNNNQISQRNLNPLDQAIQLHMQIMEHHLTDMLENLHEALDGLQHSHRLRAIGTLMQCEEAYTQIGMLYQAILALYRNADAIERPDDD